MLSIELSVSTNRLLKVLLVTCITLFITACGSNSVSDGKESDTPRVMDSDRTYTIEDFRSATGVKVVKDYEVDELPGAIEVWNTIYNRLDYEVRFYKSHKEAVSQGTRYADSVTGEDAVVTGDEVLWEEGKKDRRKCSRAAQTPHSSCTYSARYLEYVIRGNIILFCEGDESTEAFKNCSNLMGVIESPT